MYNNTNYKTHSLVIILDAYVTRNAIIDFLATDYSEFKETLVKSNPKNIRKIEDHIKKLKKELEEIDLFLNDKENFHWDILGLNKEFFDNNLPFHKRKIEWFRSVDRYPFDYTIFFNDLAKNAYTQ